MYNTQFLYLLKLVFILFIFPIILNFVAILMLKKYSKSLIGLKREKGRMNPQNSFAAFSQRKEIRGIENKLEVNSLSERNLITLVEVKWFRVCNIFLNFLF